MNPTKPSIFPVVNPLEEAQKFLERMSHEGPVVRGTRGMPGMNTTPTGGLVLTLTWFLPERRPLTFQWLVPDEGMANTAEGGDAVIHAFFQSCRETLGAALDAPETVQ